MFICILKGKTEKGGRKRQASESEREGRGRREGKSGIEIECCSISIHSRAGIAAVGL